MVNVNVVLSVGVVVLSLVSGMSAIKCYTASTKVFEVATGVPITCSTGYNYCSKYDTYLLDTLASVTRSCSLTCTALDARISGVGGAVTSCCSTDLCNSVGHVAASLPTMLAVLLFAFVTSRVVMG